MKKKDNYYESHRTEILKNIKENRDKNFQIEIKEADNIDKEQGKDINFSITHNGRDYQTLDLSIREIKLIIIRLNDYLKSQGEDK
jgi:hypothetical protein